MESNGLSFSGMLGLEMPQHPQNPHNLHHHPQMVANYAHNEPDHHHNHHHHHHPQPQQSAKTLYPYATKAKQHITVSEEDEPGSAAAEDSTGDGKKVSPWQRMKWTDNMVRLLIMAVYYIGDEAGPEANDPSGKKKGGGGLLQKKGKWKSVSRAMMEKGFYVSPQQCEDKFNDLNKRYKRVNDILGKGTACRVVENQSLLETMDLSPKMKEEVRKLLNSKHLFFREMCAYHNSCGHGGGGAAQHSPETAPEPSQSHIHHQHAQVQQKLHFGLYSSENASIGKAETEASKMARGSSEEEENVDSDNESENDDEEEGCWRGQAGHAHEADDENDDRPSRKRSRTVPSPSPLLQQLSCEMGSVLQDGAKSLWEKKHWMKTRLIQLEEQEVKYQCQAFELEKQRLKWVRFSSKKEREMERAKLENERRRLENERMVLVIRQKELELAELHHQHQLSSNRKADPSSITG